MQNAPGFHAPTKRFSREENRKGGNLAKMAKEEEEEEVRQAAGKVEQHHHHLRLPLLWCCTPLFRRKVFGIFFERVWDSHISTRFFLLGQTFSECKNFFYKKTTGMFFSVCEEQIKYLRIRVSNFPPSPWNFFLIFGVPHYTVVVAFEGALPPPLPRHEWHPSVSRKRKIAPVFFLKFLKTLIASSYPLPSRSNFR